MKRIYPCILLLILSAILCTGLSGCSNGTSAPVAQKTDAERPNITFFYDHDAGMEVARQERKPTLVFFSVPDNVGSQRMLETTFQDDEIKRLSEWLVCIHIDGSQESALCESLGITSFPTIILSNAHSQEVRRLIGRQTPDQLAVQIQILLQVMALRPQATTGPVRQ